MRKLFVLLCFFASSLPAQTIISGRSAELFFPANDARYVNVAGDTMAAPLLYNADNTIDLFSTTARARVGHFVSIKSNGTIGPDFPQGLTSGAVITSSALSAAATNTAAVARFGRYTGGPPNVAFVQAGVNEVVDIWNSASGTVARFGTDGSPSDQSMTVFGMVKFLGTTSSFPALKRNGTTIQGRLADDSGYASTDWESYQLAGNIFAQINGAYHQFSDPTGSAGFYVGNAASGVTFYDNTEHIFRTRGASANLVSIAEGRIGQQSDSVTGWTASDTDGAAALDTGLSRCAANEVCGGNGTAGNATATARFAEYNDVAITDPGTLATLTLAQGSTLATSGANSITLTSTDPTNVTLPTSGTLIATLNGSATLDFPSTAGETCDPLTITVTGADDGDVVMLGAPNAATNAATSLFNAWVSGADTVTVRHCCGANLASSCDPGSGTFKVAVID